MVGKTISHYKILEELGRGGMGVVYKAEDTKLNRTVALKFLATNKLGSGEEKQRFEQEAKAAAQLNHTNIATVYEINEHEVEIFIAMEYIEGETISDMVKTRPLKIKDAIKIAQQIAEGLYSAHELGIVHRDIKSANIMLTKKGVVKIMDFGLAKISEASLVTKAGTTLGTISYMSPEQAQGEKVDQRSDIWSVGVVLYEMVTSEHPFKGDYAQAVVYSILNEEPEPITGLRSGVPLELERIVNKALAKNPDERYQHVDEMSVDLRTFKKDLPGLTRKTTSVGPVLSGYQRPRWQRVLPWSITIIAVGAAIALWSLLRMTPIPQRPLMRFVHSLPPDQTIEDVEFFGSAVSLSPDGSQLVYAATDSGGGTKLFRRPIDQFESMPIPGTGGASNPFFSPDGQWIGFFAEGKLNKVSLMGGPPINICTAQSLYGASWGADETIIFSPTFTSGLLRVSAAGGSPKIVTNLNSEQGEISHRWPEFLPDGKSVLFTINTGMTGDAKHVAVLSLTSGERSIVVKDGTNARYTSAGYLIYLRSGSLLAAPFDIERLDVTGPAVRVLDGVESSREGGGHYSFSRNGSLVWLPTAGLIHSTSESSAAVNPNVAESSLLLVDRQGNAQPLRAPKRGYWAPRFSPDGRRVALTIELDIFILDLDRGAMIRFTFEGRNHIAIWTPDSLRLTFSSARNGNSNLFWKMADGSGIAEQLLTSKLHQDPGSWSPDGKILAYAELHPETNWDIRLLRLKDKHLSEPFPQTRFNEYHPMISPDGLWLAYSSDETGRLEVYVRSFPDGGGKSIISTEGGREPLWSQNGEELFYRTGGKVMAVAIQTEPDFDPGSPVLLFEGDHDLREMDPRGSPNYDIGPDGRFLMIKADPNPPSTQINFIVNWFEELKRLVPSTN